MIDRKIFASTIEQKAQEFFLQQEKNGELYRQLVMKDEKQLSIPLKPPIKLSEWHTNFAKGNAWLEGCQEIAARYPYFHFTYQNHRFVGMGNASIPVRITFTDIPAIFRLIGRAEEASSYKKAYATVRETVSQLLPWMLTSKGIRTFKEPTTVHIYLAVLRSLVKFFQQQRETSASPLYLRDIRLAPVDTKFWERESSFILAVYQALYPEDGIRNWTDLLTRLQLVRFPTQYAIRFLDDALRIHPKLEWFSSSPDQLDALDLHPRVIFLVENKTNFLRFPKVKDAILLFSSGKSIPYLLSCLNWLKEHPHIYYWGDMDEDGFEMLNRARSILPQIQSFLMEKDLLLRYQNQLVFDEGLRFELAKLQFLTPMEKEAFLSLRSQRLEQECISEEDIHASLNEIYLEL